MVSKKDYTTSIGLFPYLQRFEKKRRFQVKKAANSCTAQKKAYICINKPIKYDY